ncbi:MAG: hypothetical protein B6U76_10205 [Desulfurococcales archaeon ex4484_217_2]|nr:MAG: hypothetical protein B6U76_10205 [Desulfurococcales archaeon ex4484_217_2]
MSYSSMFSSVFEVYIRNIGKLIIPTLALLIAEIVLGAIVFIVAIASAPLTFHSVFALREATTIATLIASLIISFVFAGVIIALVEISMSIWEGRFRDPLVTLMKAYRRPYYPQVVLASIIVAVLIWLMDSTHSLLGFLAAGILYPILVITVVHVMGGMSLSSAASKAVNKLLNVLNVDVAALAIIFIVGLVSKVVILDLFALPLLTLYLTYILRKGA